MVRKKNGEKSKDETGVKEIKRRVGVFQRRDTNLIEGRGRGKELRKQLISGCKSKGDCVGMHRGSLILKKEELCLDHEMKLCANDVQQI